MLQLIQALWPLILLVVLMAVFFRIILPFLFRRFQRAPTAILDRYERSDVLMTPAERSFFGVLEPVVSPQFRLFAKVRLADVVRVKKGLDRSVYQSAFNSINSKHLDFVACDPGDLSVQFAIELDDSSHNRKSRQDRDVFVDDVMRQAGIPLFRFSAKRGYSPEDIRAQISGNATSSDEPALSGVVAS